ncbi:unnamed protein product, partial [Vitis vinifera]
MDSYAPLLERTRVPQPSLQRLAVISIFEKLRSAPSYIDSDSDPGTDAISQCLHSSSPAVVDQAVRELCRLVTDSKMELSRGLLELQSAIEGSNSRFVNVFVKAIGFLVHFGFQKNISLFRVESPESHPFVKVLSGGTEVHSELVQQVLLFISQNKGSRMVEVCDFLRPFSNFSVLRIAFSDSSASSFVRHLISSTASLCCSFPREAMPVFKLLMGCLRYYPQKNAEDFKIFINIMEYMVDAYTVVLKHLVGVPSLSNEAQLCGLELLETVHSQHSDHHKHFGGSEPIVELSKRLLVVQKELGLPYIPELLLLMSSLFVILIRSELEHEQLPVLKLVLFLLKWKNENEYMVGRAQCDLSEELLFVFPVINFVSSPSTSVKEAATDLLFMLEKVLVNFAIAPKEEPSLQGGFPSISRPASIIFRLLQQLWFQDQSLSPSSFFLNFASTGKTDVKEMNNGSKSWLSQLGDYSLWIVERRKSFLPISQSQEIFLTEMPLLLSAITCGLFMHHSLGCAAIDSLAAIGIMDPKLGVTMLLTILFFNNIISSKGIGFHDMLLKLLGMLPSLASHSVMIPLVVQTILPMLHENAKPVLYATATRLLCKTWEINDRAFGSLQGVLLPKGFNEFMSERNICISMAASIRDVCRKNPDRGVDLILSVSACIESRDPVIQSLGFQSLAHLCEADVIDFYTAWDVIAKNVLGNLVDPIIAHSVCLLLRWGAMDAEAYSEASRNVLQILWEVASSRHTGHGSLWAKARTSAFEALIHYEVPHIEKSIPDFKKRNLELLISETNPGAIRTMEEFEVKIITYEHITRRRLIKEKKVMVNKIEKLLDVFPQAIFSSGKNSNSKVLPGAALLCLSFTPKGVSYQGVSKGSQEVHTRYENAVVEIAASLQLSRNILLALLSLQSWKPFMQRWMRANISSFNAKAPTTILDKTSKAANAILKSMRRIAEESIPRSAENIALAISALCVVLPPEAHAVKSTASTFLLNWLFQYEHEYRQWSAAIALGLISSCLHVTDHKQKFQNITGLIEVACGSKNALVKGACGVGLGFSCQDLLTRFEAVNDSNLELNCYPSMISLQTGYEQKESSYIMGPLLSSPACEPHLASLMQEIFLVAQNSDDHQQQQYAAWAISFLRHRFFSEDSTVMKLSLWLMQLNYSGPGVISHVNTVQTVLRCLSQAPRLPALDWGAIIRRCMRYEAQVSELKPLDSNLKKVTLREECLQFSLAHANQFDSLLSFLDEISELSRFSSLELNLQSHLLSHLEDLIKIFSGSRLEKLFDDITVYLSSSVSSHQGYNPGQQSLLRVSCWKGLDHCLDEASVDSLQYITNIEKCMEVLFSLLPAVQSGGILGVDQVDSKEEWSEAINCLGKSRRGWLLDLLQVLEADLVQGDDHFIQVAKKIQARARLVKIDSIPLTELGRLKAYILNTGSHGIWDVLIEVVAALQHAEGIVKRQWLVDTVEISCITNYPSTALQFLGLLSGSCCKYMPFLILDRFTVLSDLPVTLTSLLSEPNWEFVAESLVSRLWTLTERIYNWATHISHADDSYSSSLHSIDNSENAMAAFLTHVMYHTCVSLKDYLPLEKQLRLANMILP